MADASAAIARGNEARREQRWADAAEAYREALRDKPARIRIWIQYGHALRKNRDKPGAEAAYRTALVLDETNAEAHLHLGHILKLSGRMREAVVAYGKAIELDPSRAAKAGSESNQSEADLLDDDRPDEVAGGPQASQECTRKQPVTKPTATRRDLPTESLELLEAFASELGQMLQTDPNQESLREELRQVRRGLNAWKRHSLSEQLGIPADELPVSLKFVGLGTTGLCNASCIHCPTGKPETDHAPRVPMPMALFEKLIREMADLHLETEQISFGLFGDGLVDPFVVERARLVRALLPETNLSINTNGAAYTRSKHKVLASLASMAAVHVESLVPETYNTLMQPLRAERVFPKIEQILEDFPGKVDISVPVTNMNLAELPSIRDHFMERGARGVHFDTLHSRCAENLDLFRSLALDPHLKKCGALKGKDLIVDCDGRVLMCCNDFRREEPIGNLTRESLLDTLLSAERNKMMEQFTTQRHAERVTCNRCYADFRQKGKWQQKVDEALALSARSNLAAEFKAYVDRLTPAC